MLIVWGCLYKLIRGRRLENSDIFSHFCFGNDEHTFSRGTIAYCQTAIEFRIRNIHVMQREICTQRLRPIPIIIAFNTRPATEIKYYVAAHSYNMFCNAPHNLFDASMPCVMICVSDIIAEQC